MIELLGASAVSDFRIAKLRPALEAIHPGIGTISARFVHFVDLARALDARETTLLERLLTYGPREDAQAAVSSAFTTDIFIVPRFGTISPWSSKATDIAHVCGLDAVRRIERGIVWRIAGTKRLSHADALRLAAPLFDRMTEAALLERGDAARLFVREKTRLRRILPPSPPKFSSCRASAPSRRGRARPRTSRTCAASTPYAASNAASSGVSPARRNFRTQTRCASPRRCSTA